MVAVLLWVRAELRGRWRAWAGVVLLIGLSGGVSLAATAGSRRTASSFDRFTEVAAEPHAMVFNRAGGDPSLLDAVEGIPGVEASGRVALLLLAPVGTDIRPGLDMLVFTALDDRVMHAVQRPRVLRGRLPAADRAEEVTVNEPLARRLGLAPGDRITLQGPTPAEVAECGHPILCDDKRGGPAAPVIVVGVTRSPTDLGNRTLDSFEAIAGAAFHERYAAGTASPGSALFVRLTGGQADVPAFTAAVAAISQDLGVESSRTGAVDDALRIQVQGLLVFAAVAALAGLLAVGQAYARMAAAGGAGLAVLGVLGAGRRLRWAAALGPLAVVAPTGAAVAAVVAWLASPLLPIGLGRRAEPSPGLSFDSFVLVLGALALTAAVLARASISALRVADRFPGDVPGRRDGQHQSAAGWSFPAIRHPPALPTGARMALSRGRGAHAIPVGSTLLGAVIGVSGLVGALTFDRSADRLRSESALHGAPWSAQVVVADDPVAIAAARAVAERVGRVEALGLVGTGTVGADGRPDVLAMAVEPQRGAIGATVLAGRAPVAPDEVLAGGDLLRALGRDVGDTIRLGGDGGDGGYRVVGRGSVPIINSDRRTDGVVLTVGGLSRLVSTLAGDGSRSLLVRWAPGTDLTAARRAIQDAGFVYDPPIVPTEVTNLGELGAIPKALGAFLAGLGLVATTHALAVTVQRRRRDLATLRTLGFTGADARWTVACQAMTTVVVGLGGGIPLGLVVGRSIWSHVARGLDVVDRPSIPVVALLLTAPVGLILVNLLAYLPGRSAARLRPAMVLRDE